MAPTRGKSQHAIGSAAWVSDEREQSLLFVNQEVEDFAFSTRNELDWLNEHMAEVFCKNQLNVTELFKTPGKLRGKTPRTIRKRPGLETRAPLTDIFTAKNIQPTPSPVHNAFYGKLLEAQVHKDENGSPSKEIFQRKSPQKLPKVLTDSGYHALSEDEDDSQPIPVPESQQLEELPDALPINVPVEHIDERRTTESSFHTAEGPTRTEEPATGNDEDVQMETLELPRTPIDQISPIRLGRTIIQGENEVKESITKDEVTDSKEDIASDKNLNENQEENEKENEKDQVSRNEEPTAIVLDVEDKKDEVLDNPLDEIISTSDIYSSPDIPPLRKSSLTFASLPAREPFSIKKSVGARVSRTSYIDQQKFGGPSRTSYFGRQTGGQSLGGSNSQPVLGVRSEYEMDVDDTLGPAAGRDSSNDDSLSKIHSKSSTQRLHDRITMLGQSHAPRTTKSITSLANIANVQPHYPSLFSAVNSPKSKKGFDNDSSHAGPSKPVVDDDDWIGPSPVKKNLKTLLQPSSSRNQSITTEERLSTDKEHSRNGSVVGKHHSSSPRKVESVTESTTPKGSPKRGYDGALTASKSKLQTVMRAARGLFSNGAGVAVAANMDKNASPDETRQQSTTQSVDIVSSSSSIKLGSPEIVYPSISSISDQARTSRSGSTNSVKEERETSKSIEKARHQEYASERAQEARRLELEKIAAAEAEAERVLAEEKAAAAAIRKAQEAAKREREEKEKRAREEIERRVREKEEARRKAQELEEARRAQELENERKAQEQEEAERKAQKELERREREEAELREIEEARQAQLAVEESEEDEYVEPHQRHRPYTRSQPQRPQANKSHGRTLKPSREIGPKAKPQPVSIRVGTLSQRVPLSNSALAASLSESLPPPLPLSQPTIHRNESDISVQTNGSSSSSFKSSTASTVSKPKALIAAERQREKERKEAERKAEAKKGIERKRAAAQEEARRKEQREREEAERLRHQEQSRSKATEAKRLAGKAAIEKRRQENARKAEQQRHTQRPGTSHASAHPQTHTSRKEPFERPHTAAATHRNDLGASRPPSRMHPLATFSKSMNHPPPNSARPPKRTLTVEDDHEAEPRSVHHTVKGTYAYQQAEGKRRRTNDAEEQDEFPPQSAVRPTMAPPIRQSYIRKEGLKPPPVFSHGYTTAPPPQGLHPTANMLFKSGSSTVSASKSSHPPIDMAQYTKGRIPFANPGSVPESGLSSTSTQTLKTPLSSTAAQLAPPKSSPQYPNGDNISLPDIASDSDSEDSSLFTAPAWAQSPNLNAILEEQQNVDASQIFGPTSQPQLEEIFNKSKDRHRRFRSRTSSANWSGPDGLTREEIEKDLRARERIQKEGGWRYGTTEES